MKINKIMETLEKEFKGRAVNDILTNVCVYKTSDNKKCAIGCFIPDCHPGQSETGGVSHLLNMYPDLKKMMPSFDEEKLMLFQKFHDQNLYNIISVEEQKTVLMFVAYGLFS